MAKTSVKVKCYNRNQKRLVVRATYLESESESSDSEYEPSVESESESISESDSEEISDSEDGTDYESETEPESVSEELDDPKPYFGPGYRVYFDSHVDKKKFMTAFGF